MRLRPETAAGGGCGCGCGTGEGPGVFAVEHFGRGFDEGATIGCFRQGIGVVGVFEGLRGFRGGGRGGGLRVVWLAREIGICVEGIDG